VTLRRALTNLRLWLRLWLWLYILKVRRGRPQLRPLSPRAYIIQVSFCLLHTHMRIAPLLLLLLRGGGSGWVGICVSICTFVLVKHVVN